MHNIASGVMLKLFTSIEVPNGSWYEERPDITTYTPICVMKIFNLHHKQEKIQWFSFKIGPKSWDPIENYGSMPFSFWQWWSLCKCARVCMVGKQRKKLEETVLVSLWTKKAELFMAVCEQINLQTKWSWYFGLLTIYPTCSSPASLMIYVCVSLVLSLFQSLFVMKI